MLVPSTSRYMEALLHIMLALQLALAQAHREHKVHNIVLYPDKHSWCNTQSIKQVLSYPGCTSVTIDNNVCVGACFSYSIPHTEPSDPGEVIVPYCDSCQPSNTTSQQITLQCDKSNPDTPAQLVKTVQIIRNCSCTSCYKEKDGYHRSLYDRDGLDMLPPQNDVPDLLDALHNRNETPSIDAEHSSKVKELMNHKIVTFLKNIQANNSQYDKEQLMESLRIVLGPNHKVSDKSILEFVESMNTENIELYVPKLREILTKFEHSKYHKKHRNFDPTTGVGAISLSSEEVGDAGPPEADFTPPEEVESTSELAENSTALHYPHFHHVGHHHAASAEEQTTQAHPHPHVHHHHAHHHAHPHHHVGELVTAHSHLARGPHGALVIEPEKLDVNPHELKPNHAGTLLSYQSHAHPAVAVGADIDKPHDE